MKEALIKAFGTGFSLNPWRFEMPPDLRAVVRLTLYPGFLRAPATAWWLENLGNEAFAAAVACELIPEPTGGETNNTT